MERNFSVPFKKRIKVLYWCQTICVCLVVCVFVSQGNCGAWSLAMAGALGAVGWILLDCSACCLCPMVPINAPSLAKGA